MGRLCRTCGHVYVVVCWDENLQVVEGGRAGTIEADAVGTRETEETSSLCSSHYIQEEKKEKK